MRKRLCTLGLILGLSVIAGPAQASEGSLCPSGSVRVEAKGAKAFQTVCGAAEEALAFLQTCGLAPPDTVEISVAPSMPKRGGITFVGLFDPARAQAVVPTFETAARRTRSKGWFGQPMTEPLYQSLIVHETTHAVVDQQAAGSGLSPMAHEYVAYAVQFATMSAPLRDRTLETNSHAAPIGRMELSGMYLALAPNDFAIKAYLHFAMPGHGCKFLRGVVQGQEQLPTGLE